VPTADLLRVLGIDPAEDARTELSRIRHQTAGGTYVKPSKITVSQYLDEYLVEATRGRRESTKVCYRNAFQPVRDRLGLRWADVDLKAKTLTVTQARVLVDYKVRIKESKSHDGKRTLPLDDELVSALTELRKRQAREARSRAPATGPGSMISTGTRCGTTAAWWRSRSRR
jgi:integrase